MKKHILLMSLAGLLLAGCQQKGDHHQHPRQEKPAASNASNIKKAGLRLNDGRKWEANFETTDGMRKMQNVLERFKEQEEKDYAKLYEELDMELQEIIRQCTMKGEAHQQLHYYLEPLMADMRQLDEAQNPAALQKAVRGIDQQLAVYTTYFE